MPRFLIHRGYDAREMSTPSSQAVLVTGASTGIGRATALYLAARGFRVFASVRKEKDALLLPGATPIVLDVTDADSIRGVSDAVSRALGEEPLTGLVNNAGIAVSGPLEFLEMSEIRRQFDVNLFGQVAVTQAFLPLLRRAKRGRIVNMSSISGRITAPLLGPYSMSKFALEAFSDALRRELEPFGLSVSVVEPGVIKTPIWDKGVDSSIERVARMPARALELYGGRMAHLRKRAQEMSQRGAPAEKVAKAVHHALVSARPKTRYLVGFDAKLTAKLAWLLPDRALDRLMRRTLRP
jgi:NAD(P)-dependent dehydrogenase (short-subunit alcohol dehydrogenase family)